MVPSAAAARAAQGKLKPKPALHSAGTADPLVKFGWQKLMMNLVKKTNGCAEEKPWAEHCTLFPPESGTPFIACANPGTHELPDEALSSPASSRSKPPR